MTVYNPQELVEEKKRFGERVKRFREQKGWSQLHLADELNVGIQTISNWENGYYFPKKVDDLIALARTIGCDLDYLIGNLDETTHDVKFVREFTGLSEKAIQKIRSPELGNPFGKTLSRMIESEQFSNLITSYKIFLTFLERIEADDLEKLSDYELNKDSIVLGRKEAANHFKQEVTLAMGRICETDQLTRLSKLEVKRDITDLESLKREIRSTKGEIAYLTEHLEFLEGEVLPELQNNNGKG